MVFSTGLACFLLTHLHLVTSFYSCTADQGSILSDQECSDLYFEPGEGGVKNYAAQLKVRILEGNLNFSPHEGINSCTSVFLRLGPYKESGRKICAKFSDFKLENSCDFLFSCLSVYFMSSEPYLLEYKNEKSPESVSRKFLFFAPKIEKYQIFSYIDFTDTSRLIFYAQKLDASLNITYYKVEVFKEKNSNTFLQDLHLFPAHEKIFYEYQTYNDEGDYFFNISVINPECSEDICLKSTSAKVHIGRKSTGLVIGIVGASFILPFVLFIFHVLTRQYNKILVEDPFLLQTSDQIVIVFRSGYKRHNEVISAFARMLQKFAKIRVVLDPVDLSVQEKFCSDSLILATHIIFVSPPLHENETKNNPRFEFPGLDLSDKNLCSVVFNYCAEKLPVIFKNYKTYKLPEEFDKFLKTFNVDFSGETFKKDNFYLDLLRKIEDAKFESDNLPKIVVTEFEAENMEREGLLSL